MSTSDEDSDSPPDNAPRARSEILHEWAAKRRARGAQTAETRLRYERIAESMIREHGTLDRAVSALAHERGAPMRLATFHSRKAALKYRARTEGDDALLSRLEKLRLPSARIKPAKDLPTRRLKTIPDEDLDTLIEYFRTAPERAEKIRAANPAVNPIWASRTSLFLLATIRTGLRPSEWPSARIISLPSEDPDLPEEPCLRVQTGKSISNKPRCRDIPIDNSDDLDLITRHLYEIETSGLPFRTYYQRCKDRLSAANRVCFPGRKRRISLYSGRHTFHARLVSRYLSNAMIAYLMGHALSSAVTSGRSYGRGGAGVFGPDYDPAAYQEMPDRPEPTPSADEPKPPAPRPTKPPDNGNGPT